MFKSSSLLNTKCRTCFNVTKGCKSLITKTIDHKKQVKCYAELLEEITNINIMDNKYQELPQFICGYCSKRLKSAHAFVQQAKEVNDKLCSILNEKESLKQELDCLQETQIDIESCMEIKVEYDVGESKTDKLEDNVKMSKDSVVKDIELLGISERSKYENQTTLRSNMKESKSHKDHIIQNEMLLEIKLKSDSGDDECITKISNKNDYKIKSPQTDILDLAESIDKVMKSKTLKKETEMRRRDSTTQEQQNGTDIAVPCNKCNKIFLNSKALRVHQRISHIPEERKCTCHLCGNKFTRYCNMYKHMRTFHGPDSVTLMRKPVEGDNIYECDKCSKKYSRKKSLSYHIKTKHANAQDGKDINNTNDTYKIKRKATDKGSLCPICGSSFTSKTQLTVHIRRHTGERPFKCDLCDRAFLLVTHLNSHKRVHTGEKPYKCELCGKAFRVSDHLRQHMRSHTDIRPYKCSQCERSFKYSQDLSKHLRSKKGERVYNRICENSLPRCNILRANYLKMDPTENVMNHNF